MDTGNIMENQLQGMYDGYEHEQNMEFKFEKIRKRAKRISKAIHYLYEGKPFTIPMKSNKNKTYKLLTRLQDENIQQMSNLFN